MSGKKTINVVLYPRKDKNNLYPIKIRITENRKSQFVNLNFSIPKKYWLKSTNRVSVSHPSHLEYNFIIEKSLKEWEGVVSKTDKVIVGKMNLFVDLEKKIKDEYVNQYYSKKKHRTLYYHLKNFWGSLDLHYYEIDKEFYIDFRNYLQQNIISRDTLTNIPSNNTIVGYLKVLTSFLNEKKEEGVFVGDLSFSKKVSPQKIPTPKRTLNIDEIWVLDNLTQSHNFFRPLLWDGLNTFLFNFWSQGLRIGDCLRLKWGNIQDDLIVITMGKTKRQLTIPLTSKNIYRISGYMNDLPPIWNWEKKKWIDFETGDIGWREKKHFDDFLFQNYTNYLGLLNELENHLDSNFDDIDYLLKNDNFHIRKGRYSLEYYNYVKSKIKFPFDLMSEYKKLLDETLLDNIKKYSKDEKYRNEFIFPFLRGYENERDLTKLNNKISSSITLINKSLKEIGSYSGIEKKLTNHLSRHSITSISKSLGTDIYDLKNMLGHTSIKQTEVYVNTLSTQSSIINTNKIIEGLNKL
jgi:integrase